MLARPTMQAPTHHSQPGSKLFSTPLEIRQEIYSYLIPYGLHAYLSDRGQLQLSGCVEPCVNGGMEGDERRGMEDFSPEDPVWLRRLMSSWGPHWRCEEMAQRIQYWFPGASKIDASDSNKDLTVLRVCKKIYAEIMSFTAIYVVDFDTLDILLQAADAASSETSTISEHVVKTATLIRSLRIILRLPLATCEAIEHARNLTSSVSSLNKAYTWMRLCSAITGLQGLRRLHIWLDHEDKSSWSVVHERAILSPLSTLTNVSNLNISVNLPKLHPILETPERHFMKETPAPPFSIERRRPQQYHSVPDSGALAVEYFPDFPCYSDFDYAWSLTNDEVEELEREMWKNGEDVQADALGYPSFNLDE